MNRNDDISEITYSFSDDEIVLGAPPSSETHTIGNCFEIQAQPWQFEYTKHYTKHY